MFVLGIDPGLTTTGYGVVEASATAQTAVAAGVIRTDPKRSVAGRLLELRRDLRGLIEEYEPVEAAIEEVFVNKNLHTAMSVARASGVALVTLAEAGLEVAEYTPSAVKMALCGYGNADKEQVQKVVAMRLQLPGIATPADASDALAIALCHVQTIPMRRAVEQVT
jgi:crossover junction endodeoxyribonuclease RuvC